MSESFDTTTRADPGRQLCSSIIPLQYMIEFCVLLLRHFTSSPVTSSQLSESVNVSMYPLFRALSDEQFDVNEKDAERQVVEGLAYSEDI